MREPLRKLSRCLAARPPWASVHTFMGQETCHRSPWSVAKHTSEQQRPFQMLGSKRATMRVAVLAPVFSVFILIAQAPAPEGALLRIPDTAMPLEPVFVSYGDIRFTDP